MRYNVGDKIIMTKPWHLIRPGDKFIISGYGGNDEYTYITTYKLLEISGAFYYEFIEDRSILDKKYMRTKKLERILK